MSGDYSRKTFDPLRDFAAVLQQQGHPALDADWNEYAAIIDRRMRATTVDTIGRAIVPRETPLGFQITASAGPALTIGRGRMYVDGLLAENHGAASNAQPRVFDRVRMVNGAPVGVLDEMTSGAGGDFVAYNAQPYLPNPPALPTSSGPHLVYLDVWQREVTPFKDPRLLEPALNGIDSATRMQTVWQVKVLADVGAGTTCTSAVAAYSALTAPSAARLTTATIQFADPNEPCLLPPTGGYRGLENQLYRVEIHQGTGLGDAKFKWSRENASVGATVESFISNTRLRVRRIGRDQILRFVTGDWVEVTDDRREFAGRSGDMRQVEVDEDTNELRFTTALSADLVPSGQAGDTPLDRHSRVIRWDQRGTVFLADGTQHVDLDAAGSDGLIPVPTNGAAVVLEAGITVSFTAAVAGGPVRAMDHWCFAARTAGPSLEILTGAPPQGIHHHYARLATVTFPNTVLDCRIFWPPPASEGDGCCCTVCVSPEQHNSGALTIQSALAQIPAEGGTLCLVTGDYILGDKPVEIAGRQSLHVTGQGPTTRLLYNGSGGALRIADTSATEITDIGILMADARENSDTPVAGIHVRNALATTIRRTAIVASGRASAPSFGIALDGNQIGLIIAENAIYAGKAIAALTSEKDEPGYCALTTAYFDDNALIASQTGLSLERSVAHALATRITGNLIIAGEHGIATTGIAEIEKPAGELEGEGEPSGLAALTIADNIISAGLTGITSAVPQQTMRNNSVALGKTKRDGIKAAIVLTTNELMALNGESSIHDNRLSASAGVGIWIDSDQTRLRIDSNVIARCTFGAVAMAERGRVDQFWFSRNAVEDVGDEPLRGDNIGIAISELADARISENTFRRIGANAKDSKVTVALDVQASRLLDISGNTFSAIGPVEAPGDMFAVRIDLPVGLVTVARNRMIGRIGRGEGSYCGIAIFAGREEDKPFSLAADTSRPMYFRVGGSYISVGKHGYRSFAAGVGASIRITQNDILDASLRSHLPLVGVLMDLEDPATISFCDNRCSLETPGPVEAIVELRARSIAFAQNTVRRATDANAVSLEVLEVDKKPNTTVLGNLTYGVITVNGGNVPPDFAKLNLLLF
jgi:hypothetical protein